MLATVNKQQALRQPLQTWDIREETGGAGAIEQIALEWRALCAEGPCDQPFFQPEWIAAYLRAFAADQKLALITVRRNGRLRAVAPLIEERGTLHGLPVRKLRSAANVHSCRFDLIHGATDREEAMEAVWEWLRNRDNWDVIELADVPAGGAAETLLNLARADRHPGGQWEKPAGPFLTIPSAQGKGVEETIRALLRNSLRKTIRKDRRKLETEGPLQLAHLTDASPDDLAVFYELESAGWKGQVGTAIACAAETRRFYDEVARVAAAHGYFSLYRLVQNGRPLSMQYGLFHQGHYYLLKPAYDEQFRQYSPGSLLMEDILSDLVAQDACECDFMPPVSPWKSRWASGQRAQSDCYIFRRSLMGQALHAWKFRILLQARRLKQKYRSVKNEGATL